MNPGHQLKYFDKILFIDPNPNIKNEIKYFTLIFGEQLLCFPTVIQAKSIVVANPDLKYVIICSSRIIDDIIQNIKGLLNIFYRPIVFCGSFARCEQVKKDYQNRIYEVDCKQQNIVSKLAQLEQKLNQVENKVKLKVLWLLRKESDLQRVHQQFGELINKLQISQGINISFQTEETLQESLEYFQEMQKHLQVLVFADDRSNQWESLLPNLKAAKQKFNNVVTWIVFRPEGKEGEMGEDFVSQVTSIQELQICLFSLVDWPTL